MTDEPQDLDYRLFDPANDGDLALAHVNEVVLTLARLLGRQIARDEYDRLHLADPAIPPEDQTPR